MRFMMIVKASKVSEAGVLPDERILSEMGQYNEELVKAGALLAAEGLQASSKGTRVRYSNGKFKVIDGPFAETKELIAGFWLIQVESREDAIEWARRVPFQEGEVEVRPLFELTDFPVDPPRSPTDGGRRNSRSATPHLSGSPERFGTWASSRPTRIRSQASSRTKSPCLPWGRSLRKG
jgi:hypothetical protein